MGLGPVGSAAGQDGYLSPARNGLPDPAAPGTRYDVKDGDSMTRIARDNGISTDPKSQEWKDFLSANKHIADPNRIWAKDKIVIPAKAEAPKAAPVDVAKANGRLADTAPAAAVKKDFVAAASAGPATGATVRAGDLGNLTPAARERSLGQAAASNRPAAPAAAADAGKTTVTTQAPDGTVAASTARPVDGPDAAKATGKTAEVAATAAVQDPAKTKEAAAALKAMFNKDEIPTIAEAARFNALKTPLKPEDVTVNHAGNIGGYYSAGGRQPIPAEMEVIRHAAAMDAHIKRSVADGTIGGDELFTMQANKVELARKALAADMALAMAGGKPPRP